MVTSFKEWLDQKEGVNLGAAANMAGGMMNFVGDGGRRQTTARQGQQVGTPTC